jgi:hypothetical protein
MVISELGSVMDVSEEHHATAKDPILRRLDGAPSNAM